MTDDVARWAGIDGPAPETVEVRGVAVARGARVRLVPHPGRDLFDLVLAGRVAVVDTVEQDLEGRIHVAVTIEDDPGRDLGEMRQPGHRFFFDPEEVEPLGGPDVLAPRESRRVLVAGIGNVFLGDDGFGVEVVRLLEHMPLPAGVEAADFGIRGLDLAYALTEGYDAAVFVDATPRGQAPGTLYVIEPEIGEDDAAGFEAHGMDPVKVLGLARQLGPVPARILIVGCEPETIGGEDDEELVGELSAPVRRAVAGAAETVVSLLDELIPSDEDEREVSRA
jgi:hydrogenase maturation protease